MNRKASVHGGRSADFSPQQRSNTPGFVASLRGRSLLRTKVRAYSSSKVIHRWRGRLLFPPPQSPVNNFGGSAKMCCEQLSIWLNRQVEHAGSGRRIPRSNVTTFWRRLSLRDPAPCRKGTLRTFRLQVQTWQRRTSISSSVRQGLRAQQTDNKLNHYESNH